MDKIFEWCPQFTAVVSLPPQRVLPWLKVIWVRETFRHGWTDPGPPAFRKLASLGRSWHSGGAGRLDDASCWIAVVYMGLQAGARCDSSESSSRTWPTVKTCLRMSAGQKYVSLFSLRKATRCHRGVSWANMVGGGSGRFCLMTEKARTDHANYGICFQTTLLPIWSVCKEWPWNVIPCTWQKAWKSDTRGLGSANEYSG